MEEYREKVLDIIYANNTEDYYSHRKQFNVMVRSLVEYVNYTVEEEFREEACVIAIAEYKAFIAKLYINNKIDVNYYDSIFNYLTDELDNYKSYINGSLKKFKQILRFIDYISYPNLVRNPLETISPENILDVLDTLVNMYEMLKEQSSIEILTERLRRFLDNSSNELYNTSININKAVKLVKILDIMGVDIGSLGEEFNEIIIYYKSMEIKDDARAVDGTTEEFD